MFDRRGGSALRRLLLIALVVSGLSGAKLFAQAPPAATVVLRPVGFDVSPPLRSIPPIRTVPSGPPEERELLVLPLHDHTPATGRTAANPFLAPPTLNPPTLGTTFDGVGNTNYTIGGAPPDTEGAVGPNHYFQWVNSAFYIFSKAGAQIYPAAGQPANGNTIWTGFAGAGGHCANDNRGDPLVQYDQMADRWFASQFAWTGGFPGPGPFYQCVAVSTSGDPTGTWFRYAYGPNQVGGADAFPDYAKSGVWPDGYYMTINQFNTAGAWDGGGILVANRLQMILGNPAATILKVNMGAAYGGQLVSSWDGMTPPPAGEPGFIMSFDNVAANCPGSPSGSCLQIWKAVPDFALSTLTVTGPTILNTPAIIIGCNNASGACVPQTGGGTSLLDTLADRLMWRLAYRNFPNAVPAHESMVFTQTIDPDGAGAQNAEPRWYEIRDPNGTPTIFQNAVFNPTTTQDRWMGSAAMDKFGDIGLGFSNSSATMFPSISFTGRLPGDPVNTMQAQTTMFAGTGSQNGGLTRWGDYSALTPDPVDDCTFWFTTEYLKATGSFNWSTRIGNFKFASCVACTVQAVPTGVSVVNVNQTTNTVSWTAQAGAQFNVYRSTSPVITTVAQCPAGIFYKLNSAPIVGTSYTDSTGTGGTTYWYEVSTVDAATANCESLRTACLKIINPSCVTPGVPGGVTAAATAPNQITVNWTASAPAATSYNILRSGGSCPGGVFAVIGTSATTSYIDNTATGTAAYSYTVQGVNGACTSVQSACASAIAYGDCLTAPTFAGLTSATAAGGGACTINLAWSAATPNCGTGVSYNIYRSTTTGFAPSAATRIFSGVSATSYADNSGLAGGTTYFYVVRAVDNKNSVEDANTVERSAVAPAACSSGPLSVQAFTATATGNSGAATGQNQLEWWSPVSAPAGTTITINYRTDVYPTGPADASATVILSNRAVTAGAVDTFTHTGLTLGTTYYYAIWVRF
jgi:fibronectin type 3 domain-containing protein